MEKVEVTPVIGLPQLTGWSHVVSNRERTLTCAFAIEGLHASNVGRDVADELEHLEPENAAAFYSFLTRLHRDVSQKECTLYLAAALLVQGKGVFIGLNGTIILHRQEKLGKVLQAEEMFQVIEGTWQPEDFFILLTAPALALLNEIEQKIRQGFDQDTVIASLVPSVHMLDNSSLHAIAFAKKHEVSVPLAEEVADPEAADTGFAIDFEVGEPVMDDIQPTDSEQNITKDDPEIIDRAHTRMLENLVHRPEVFPPDQAPPHPASARPKVELGKVWQGVTRAAARVVQPLVARIGKPFSGEVYVTSLSGRKLARRVVPGLLVALLVVGGGGYYWYQRQTARSQVEAQLTEITAPVDIVRAQAVTDPIAARVAMNDILNRLKMFKETAESNHGIPTLIDAQIAEVQSTYDAISGLEEINALEPFFDLRLVASDFVASEVVTVKGGLVLIDSGKKQLINLSLPNKQYETRSLEEREAVQDVTVNGAGVVVLAGGVYQYPLNEGESSQIIANDEQVKAASEIAFFNDAYYVLNPEKQNIFRYRADENDEYKVAVGWIRTGEAIDFNQTQSIAIDGDLWVSTKDGKIYRYNSGRQETFEPTGLTTPFTHSLWVVTSESFDNLYVLEPDNKRLVILNKDGNFLREIQSSSLATATGLALSDDEKTAYVISGSLVYQIPL